MGLQSSVQFNLLPAVKIAYLRARKTRQKVMYIAIAIMSVTIVVVLVMLSLLRFQSKTMKDLTNSTSLELKKIKTSEDLEKYLTLQSQLAALPSLHEQKTNTSNIFDFLNRLIPEGVVLQNVSVEHTDSALTITGSATSLELVNVLADTLKFTTFTATTEVNGERQVTEPVNAFSAVTTSADRSEGKVSFVINSVFDVALFDNTKTIALQVPSKVTSRSVIEQPALFDGTPSLDKTEDGGSAQ